MFFYDKKIRYLNYYENGIRLQNAGYVKFEVRDYVCQMLIYIKGPRLMGNGEARIWFLMKTMDYNEDNKKLLGTIGVRAGQGRQVMRLNAENMGETGLTYRQIAGIRIELQRQQYLECSWEAEAEYVNNVFQVDEKLELSQEQPIEMIEPIEVTYKEVESAEEEESIIIHATQEIEELHEEQNKEQDELWETWKDMFPQIHPLDDRECLKLTPRNLEILQEEERGLMHNSFLLHGFYNYRHLILWKENTSKGTCFCLGVPGVFHEREKILAKMFGFEYFCCQSKVPRAGNFGYYYRYVLAEC